MNRISQEARSRQAVVKLAMKKRKELCSEEVWCESEQREAVVQAVRWHMAIPEGAFSPSEKPPTAAHAAGRGVDP